MILHWPCMTRFPLNCALTALALHTDEGVNVLFSASHSALFLEFPFVQKPVQGDPCRKKYHRYAVFLAGAWSDGAELQAEGLLSVLCSSMSRKLVKSSQR